MSSLATTRLRDGRAIRALADGDKKIFNQAEAFGLQRLLLPSETILTVNDHNQSIRARIHGAINVNNLWRALEFGFYPRGFEADLTLPMGNRLIWTEMERNTSYDETGRMIVAVFAIPDVPVIVSPRSESIGLRRATGMGVIPISKLQLTTHIRGNIIFYEIFPSSDFDPKKDLRVKDVSRPNGWTAAVDEDGFGLLSGRIFDDSGRQNFDAKMSTTRRASEFEEIAALVRLGFKPTGWLGSILRGAGGLLSGRNVAADSDWSIYSGVAAVENVQV